MDTLMITTRKSIEQNIVTLFIYVDHWYMKSVEIIEKKEKEKIGKGSIVDTIVLRYSPSFQNR